MPQRLPSVLVIDENAVRAAIIEAGLREAGHENVTVVSDVAGIAARIAVLEPDVIVIDLENPNRDMLESVFRFRARSSVRSPCSSTARIAMQWRQAIAAGVSAYVVDGLRRERVKPILDMAISRFNAYSRLERELEDARSALQSRKVIDQAKALLMRSRAISEEEAYALLRKTAMNQNRKIADVAQSLMLAADMLGKNWDSKDHEPKD